MTGEPTNEDRANRIEPTLIAYATARGDGNGEFDAGDIPDVLADLMHFARREGYNFDAWMSTARMHFDAEMDENEKEIEP